MPFDSTAMAAVAAEIRDLLGGKVQQAHQPESETVVLTLRARGTNHRLLLSAHARYARVHFVGRGECGSLGVWGCGSVGEMPATERRETDPAHGGPSAAGLPSPVSHPLPHPSTPPHSKAPPPPFCMLLRKHLKGATLTDARQIDFDRILHLRFRYADTEVLLVLEAMGKHSNLILVSAEGAILDAIKRVGTRESRLRPIQPGLPFAAPPISSRADPAAATEEQVRALFEARPGAPAAEVLSDGFHLSPAALEAVIRESGSAGVWGCGSTCEQAFTTPPDPHTPTLPHSCAAALRAVADPATYAPALLYDARDVPVDAVMLPEVPPPPGGRREPAGSASEALECYYSYRIAHEAVESRRRALLRALADAERFSARRIREAEQGVEAARRAPDLEREATLLISNLHRVARGAESVTVVDFYDPEQKEVTLALDPSVPVREQAEKRFKRARKLVDAVPHLERQWEEEQERLESLQVLRPALEAARTATELDELAPALGRLGALRERPAQAPKRQTEESPGMQHRTLGGYEVLLGRNATENDHLTTRVADPDDIWLHARGITSAHVVIRTHKHPEKVPHTVLLEAAKLCALHSQAKHSGMVPVDYTLRKYVVKRRGMGPGKVQYTHEKTVDVAPGL